jgi:hypothetical protein
LKVTEITNYIRDLDFKLDRSHHADGRVNSAINEYTILQKIRREFPIDVPRIRGWYDFGITASGIFYPVNIKISTFKGNDNLNCKLGLYYTLTDTIPEFKNEIGWSDFFFRLFEDMSEVRDTKSDYYFIVINKNDTNDVFWTSLKRISMLTPNGNNLPFQAKWSDNRKRKRKSHQEVKYHLLGTLLESWRRRAKPFGVFESLVDLDIDLKGLLE